MNHNALKDLLKLGFIKNKKKKSIQISEMERHFINKIKKLPKFNHD